jgi:hypothetical protein
VKKLVALRNLYGLQYYTARRGRVTGGDLPRSVLNAVDPFISNWQRHPIIVHQRSIMPLPHVLNAVTLNTFTHVQYKAVALVDLPGIVIVKVNNIPSPDLVTLLAQLGIPR